MAVGGVEGGAGVEAEPADPEEGAADHGVDDVVRLHVLDAPAPAGPQHD